MPFWQCLGVRRDFIGPEVFPGSRAQRSIAAAAGAQHVAASAVSRQIAKLEDELGIALFERQARGMALSDAGRQLAAYASAAALEAERVATEIRHRGEQGDVTVRLACTEGFAHRFLPQCMAEFKRLRPQARFPAGRAARGGRPPAAGRPLANRTALHHGP